MSFAVLILCCIHVSAQGDDGVVVALLPVQDRDADEEDAARWFGLRRQGGDEVVLDLMEGGGNGGLGRNEP